MDLAPRTRQLSVMVKRLLLMNDDGTRFFWLLAMSFLRKYSSQAKPEVLEAMQKIATRRAGDCSLILATQCANISRAGSSSRHGAMWSKHFRKASSKRDELYRAPHK